VVDPFIPVDDRPVRLSLRDRRLTHSHEL
jgi:hypothetical protein